MRGDGKVNKLSLIDSVYIAAFIDGEGTITINKSNKNNFRPRVNIANTDKDILIWIKKTVGKGFISTRNWDNPKWNTGYTWTLDGHLPVKNFLCQIFQFLKIKNKQAIMCLGFPNKESGYYKKCEIENEKIIYVQDLICKRMKEQNKRGRDVGENIQDMGTKVQVA